MPKIYQTSCTSTCTRSQYHPQGLSILNLSRHHFRGENCAMAPLSRRKLRTGTTFEKKTARLHYFWDIYSIPVVNQIRIILKYTQRHFHQLVLFNELQCLVVDSVCDLTFAIITCQFQHKIVIPAILQHLLYCNAWTYSKTQLTWTNICSHCLFYLFLDLIYSVSCTISGGSGALVAA